MTKEKKKCPDCSGDIEEEERECETCGHQF